MPLLNLMMAFVVTLSCHVLVSESQDTLVYIGTGLKLMVPLITKLKTV